MNHPSPDDAGAHLRHEFERARKVSPRAIRGDESTRDLLIDKFPAFVGRQLRQGYELMERSCDEGYSVFLTLSGAMTPAGLHSSCLLPLLERGLVECLTTTGANLYHDAHRVIGHGIREIDPNAGDLHLRDARIIRIYDLGFDEAALLDTDKLFSAILLKPEFQRRMTTTEFHNLLGKEIAAIEEALQVESPSLLATAWRLGVPIFVGAVQDGSVFLNAVKLKALYGDAFRFELDVNRDVFEMGAMQYYVAHELGRKMAIWILGGGVPKNYTLQGEPLLSQILEVEADGFDIDVQFCVDPVDNGALSSCPAGEGHTWGKITAEGVSRSVYVHTDVTVAVPWVTHALLSEPSRRRPPARLFDQRAAALRALEAAVQDRAESLRETCRSPFLSAR
jgi:deoxyhypusine synthase